MANRPLFMSSSSGGCLGSQVVNDLPLLLMSLTTSKRQGFESDSRHIVRRLPVTWD